METVGETVPDDVAAVFEGEVAEVNAKRQGALVILVVDIAEVALQMDA